MGAGQADYASNLSSKTNFNDILKDFTETFVEPLVNYLHDSLDEGGSLLYLLEKYKNKVEWFEKIPLFALYAQDTSRGEMILDFNLRAYLFDQGIDYPFSTPASPSGRADIVGNLHTKEPLVLETKIFNPDKHSDKAYIKQGVRQIYDYANDYNKSCGYYVIFNCSDKNLLLKFKENESWPPRLHLGDKTLFFIIVELYPHEKPASQRKRIEPYEITEDYLTSIEEQAIK